MSLLKLLLENGRYFGPIALFSGFVALARHYGFLTQFDELWVQLLYAVGLFSLSVLIAGLVRFLWKKFTNIINGWRGQRKLYKSALKNISILPAPYITSLLWLYIHNQKSVSDPNANWILYTLETDGYLIKESKSINSSIDVYHVREEIWNYLKKVDEDGGLSEPRLILPHSEPPWRRRSMSG